MQTSSTTVFDFCPFSIRSARNFCMFLKLHHYKDIIPIDPPSSSLSIFSVKVYMLPEVLQCCLAKKIDFITFFSVPTADACTHWPCSMLIRCFFAFPIYFYYISTRANIRGAYFDSHYTALSNEVMQSQYSTLVFVVFVFLLCYIYLWASYKSVVHFGIFYFWKKVTTPSPSSQKIHVWITV